MSCLLAIKALFDGEKFRPLEPIPVDKEYLVAITFLEPIRKDQSRLVEFAGMLSDDDVEAIAKVVAERPNLLYGRSSEA